MTDAQPLQLLYSDESNIQPKNGDFLLYGGIIISSSVLQEFSAAVDDLRAKFSIPRDYKLKFNPGPINFTHNNFIEIKQSLIELAIKFDTKLLVYAIMHDIAKRPDEARRNGINTVCFHFDCILNSLKAVGLVLIDRFNDEGNKINAHVIEKFMVGLTDMPFSKEMRLNRILGFHYSAIGQSHFPSVIDVLLGSLRFSINAFTRSDKDNLKTARTLLKSLSPLFFRAPNKASIPELGFMLSPKTVKVDEYRARYKSLIVFLAESGLQLEQTFD